MISKHSDIGGQSVLSRDFKSHPGKRAARKFKPHHPILALAGLVAGFGIMLGFSPDDAGASREPDPRTTIALPLSNPILSATEQGIASDLMALPEGGATKHTSSTDGLNWQTVIVKKGDTLSHIFKRNGISAQQLQNLLASTEKKSALRNLYPGDTLDIKVDSSRRLLALRYDVDESSTLKINRVQDKFINELVSHPVEKRSAVAKGTIDSSLFLAAQRAGLSDNLTMELAGIFGWDIDFVLDIRKGDSFSVIYEELYSRGEKLRDGKILAAEFTNRGKSYYALRYTDNDQHTDYYDKNGRSLRKAFLRSPVDFSRISSKFSLGRKHPVLNTIRAHKGVDYAAPRGTPIKATSDGKIVHRGRKGGFGNTIILQHGSSYSTLYAHLSGYARGIVRGKRVKQGQIIAYVGSTGLATGPHLHYEFRVNGVHRDPLTVKLPDAAPLAKKYSSDFYQKSRPLLAQLDVVKRIASRSGHTTIALNTP
ncbi:MAG: peptidoglycan DD-metalloendopeptidase family protein [Gammaproteobacteria bacterium]